MLKKKLKEASSPSPWSTPVSDGTPPRDNPLSCAASLWVNYGTQSSSPDLTQITVESVLLPRSDQIISQSSIAMKKAMLNGSPNSLSDGATAQFFPVHDYSHQDKMVKTGWDSKLPDPIVMKQMLVLLVDPLEC